MNYKKIYDALIEKRKQTPYPKDLYGEKHHIIPKCMGGDNSKSNLVRLSAREHYIAHALLVKIYRDKKQYYYRLLNAYSAMVYLWGRVSKEGNPRNINRNSHLYQKWKEDISEYRKKYCRGEKSNTWGKKAIYNIESNVIKYVKDPKPYIDTGNWLLGNPVSKKNKGENSNTWNTIHIYNVETGKCAVIDKNSPIPDGFKQGFPTNSKIHIQHYNPTKGKIWICNDELKQMKLINPEDEISEGWRRGTFFIPPKSGKPQRNVGSLNKKWIINKETLEVKQILKDSEIPDGWVYGRTIKLPKKQSRGRGLKGRMWITNELLKENKVIDKTDEVPEGWRVGRKNY